MTEASITIPINRFRDTWQRVKTTARTFAPLAGGALIGLSWHAEAQLLVLLTLILPVIWWRSTYRWQAGGLWFAYYLALSTDIAPNFIAIYPDIGIVVSLAVWIACAGLLSAGWFFLWSENKSIKNASWRLFAGFLISTLPPIGLLSWSSPLLAAGLLFPGLGLAGLLLTAALPLTFLLSGRPAYALRAAAVAFVVYANVAFIPREMPVEWFGLGTSMGKPPDVNDTKAWHNFRAELVAQATRAFDEGAKIVVTPEMLAGEWHDLAQMRWRKVTIRNQREGTATVVGAIVPVSKTRFRNGVIVSDKDGMRTYGARTPMPVGLWKPWSDYSAESDWLGDGRIVVNGRTMALSVCYEDFMVFSQAMSLNSLGKDRPEALISIGNNWFAVGRTSVFIQETSVLLMASLFNTPVIRAINF